MIVSYVPKLIVDSSTTTISLTLLNQLNLNCSFFKPLNPVNVVIHFNSDGRASGEADVDFATHEEAQEAMKKDRASMRKFLLLINHCTDIKKYISKFSMYVFIIYFITSLQSTDTLSYSWSPLQVADKVAALTVEVVAAGTETLDLEAAMVILEGWEEAWITTMVLGVGEDVSIIHVWLSLI